MGAKMMYPFLGANHDSRMALLSNLNHDLNMLFTC